MDCNLIKFAAIAVQAQKALLINQYLSEGRKVRRCHVSPWLTKRESFGLAPLLKQLSVEDENLYRNILRMKPTQFQALLNLVRPKLT